MTRPIYCRTWGKPTDQCRCLRCTPPSPAD